MKLSEVFTKPALASTAIQGGIGSVALGVSLYTQGKYPEAAAAIITGVMAIYGRWTAKETIEGILPK